MILIKIEKVSAHEHSCGCPDLQSEEDDTGQMVVDAVNEMVSSLPMNHKHRNRHFAKKILLQISEILKNKKIISYEEAQKIVFELTGQIKIF